jgi:hypothetical protein
MRVELFSLGGHLIFTSGPIFHRTWDWPLRHRKSLANGVYLYTATVRDWTGQESQYGGKLALFQERVGVSQPSATALLPGSGSRLSPAQSGLTAQLPDLTRSQSFLDDRPIKIHLAGPKKFAGERSSGRFRFKTFILSDFFHDVVISEYKDKLVDLDRDRIADGVLRCSQLLLADPLLVTIFVELLIGSDVFVVDAGFVDIDLLAFARRPACEFEFFDDIFASKRSSFKRFVQFSFTGTLTDSFHVAFDEIEADFNRDWLTEVLVCEAEIRFTVRRRITVLIDLFTGVVVDVASRGGILILRARHRDVECEIF